MTWSGSFFCDGRHLAIVFVGLAAVMAAPDAAAQDYSIGIVSADGTCPSGTATIWHYMDEEDSPAYGNYISPMGWPTLDSYGSYTVGWTGAISASHAGGVTFAWCKVDGTQFKPLAAVYDRSRNYAVLKLGTMCPPGSEELSRYFDNEDGEDSDWYPQNNNWVAGALGPNVVTWNTQLYFCVFRSAADAMAQPPDLGVPYGLLARHYRGPEQFPFALASGYVHCDDEDLGNQNQFFAAAEVDADARRIIEPFKDRAYGSSNSTYLHVVQASNGTGTRCGSCGGIVLTGGACSVATPTNHGTPCGPDGAGRIQCNGVCTMEPHPVPASLVASIVAYMLSE
jgi:hypothetical protein